jgi:excinuclease ABC subunit A
MAPRKRKQTPAFTQAIRVRGARTHNLKGVDLDVPRGQMTVFCGVSGSGKTSMALDTLFAEGQRRFIETFSAYTRQFLDQLDKPPVESIDGIPPAVAITRHDAPRSNRATVATASELGIYLQMLLASVHEVVCPRCHLPIASDSPESVAGQLAQWGPARLLLTVATDWPAATDEAAWRTSQVEQGFVRAVAAGQTIELADQSLPTANGGKLYLVVDRLRGDTATSRITESLESAFDWGNGQCCLFAETDDPHAERELIDGRPMQRWQFSRSRRCRNCELEIPTPQPRLFDFNSPLGACPECEGFGSVSDIDPTLVVPDQSLTLRQGAIAPWNTPAYRHELDELIALAASQQLRLDVPYAELQPRERDIVWRGVPAADFGGLDGFFRWLDARKYKMHLRVFASRWRSYRECPTCQGGRLRIEALAYRLDGHHMADIMALSVNQARQFIARLPLAETQRQHTDRTIGEIASRLDYLQQVGVGYLELNRALRTLSTGELQRVSMTTSLGSTLVDMLYVLDEPTAGLHRADTPALAAAMHALRDRGNTVVVVEHEESVLRGADWAIEFGPRAGSEGGEVIAQSTPAELAANTASGTGDWLSGRRSMLPTHTTPRKSHGRLQLLGARGNNLKNIDVEFPLGVMCVVTGVSGAGKTSLVDGTLYPAIARQLASANGNLDSPALPAADLLGASLVEHVVRMDQSPVARSPRSNPVTYIKAFDAIRSLLADLPDAKQRGFGPGHFSFNVEGGRCEVCQGAGQVAVDMHFMADVFMACRECEGRRYRPDVLDIRYRSRNIAEILEMTVYEAFRFFRGENKLQARLKTLIDVGLDYLPLGQSANTLSGGESQRLKLAGYLSEKHRGRTLFIFDEPSVGLHFSDIAKLIDCLAALVDVGHSLVIVEHNLQMILAADHVIDLGPGPAARGGKVIATGTPQQIAKCEQSATGRVLADYYRRAESFE